MFRVGQKVVCVDASAGRVFNNIFLRKNSIYTIRGFDLVSDPPRIGLYLEEVELPPLPKGFSSAHGHETSWMVERFRPIVTRKTDISIFTRMLTPNKLEEV